MFKNITRTVFALSLISLFTDMASEMLYPVLPLYLKTIGYSIIFIGVLEGVAEAVAGLSKGYFGKLSDATGKRAIFVQAGYGMSALSKPMMAFFVHPLWIFFARTLDRFGKGIRTGARDAILSDETIADNKGRVFGFHRSADTLGAVLGPLLALGLLHYRPGEYITLFYIAFIPGLAAIGISLLLKDKTSKVSKEKQQISFFSFLGYWKESPAAYKKVAGGMLAFTLVNSSDVFLLLKAKQSGLDDTAVIGVYIFYNVVYALFAFPVGIIADKLGLKRMYITGLLLFATVYFGMSFDINLYSLFGLFFLYGLYAAASEGISKAWLSNIAERKDTAVAIGTFTGFQSIGALIASSVAGLIWYNFGAPATFIVSGAAVVLVAGYMYFATE